MRGILDNDLYKFTMQQAICQHFPRSIVRYKFHNRGRTNFPDNFAKSLKAEISSWVQYTLSERACYWLIETCPFLSPVYLDFLRGYVFDPNEVKIQQFPCGNIEIIVEGPWYRAVLWEVPLLATISEFYFQTIKTPIYSRDVTQKINLDKAQRIKCHKLTVSDFGTRRRYSYDNHETVIKALKGSLVGTSNVRLAYHQDIKPIGTHAHEWVMYHAVKYGYNSANYMALKNWANIFKGKLGIALTDTYTSDVFLQSFDTLYSKLFDGVRQDSGDPFAYIDKIIKHYKQHRIDPSTKTIVFSDSLNIDLALRLKAQCDEKGIKCAFGIGTNLTNDVGATPLNIVIKLDAVFGRNKQWLPTVKLSDDINKHTGNKNEINLCKEILRC